MPGSQEVQASRFREDKNPCQHFQLMSLRLLNTLIGLQILIIKLRARSRTMTESVPLLLLLVASGPGTPHRDHHGKYGELFIRWDGISKFHVSHLPPSQDKSTCSRLLLGAGEGVNTGQKHQGLSQGAVCLCPCLGAKGEKMPQPRAPSLSTHENAPPRLRTKKSECY